uniref:Reverse transcriptase N-terminal domain-containing protein n=1 Tax=Leiomenia cribrosa TaxID=217483 RepID=A0A4D6WW41_9FLOR|nr:hypothetical protein [Leiomenia cribrosa]
MVSIKINYNTEWNSLPWNQINEKIYVIQKKIYQYSRDCNKQNLHRIQRYMMNSSDIKVLAIHKVLYSIEQYYLNNNKEKYIFNNIDKVLIYETLFNRVVCNIKFSLVLNKIKQYIIYLCISPEWEARLEPIYRLKHNMQIEYYFIERLSKFLSLQIKTNIKYTNRNCTNHSLIHKFINTDYVINKMQSLTDINLYIKYWAKNQSYIESLYKISNIDNSNICVLFNQLINRIIYNGLQWLNMIELQNYIKNFNLFKEIFVCFNKNFHSWIYHNYILYKKICLNNILIFYRFISFNYISDNRLININKNIACSYLIHKENNNILTVQLNTGIYKCFIKRIRDILYHKDILGRWRINNKKILLKYLNQINVYIIYFYFLYYPIINAINLKTLFKLIDSLFISWIKKNKQDLSLYYNNQQYLIKYLTLKYR